jgi:predicted SnoaL-like aldol condensation-catalyzing enzyme
MTAEQNKKLAVEAFHEFTAGNTTPLRTLLREDFLEHSPGNPSGRDAFLDFIATAPVASARLDLCRVIADDTHVVMHYLMTTEDNPCGVAVSDIWRFEGSQIVEHWDVVQPVPHAAEVPNGMV